MWLMKEQGFVGTNATKIGFRPHRTWWYYEHPSWPKPPHCNRPDALRVGNSVEKSACTMSAAVLASFLPKLNLMFLHPPKTGSMTIESYIKDRKGIVYYCKDHFGRQLEKDKISTVIFSTRPPVQRFGSGVGEIFYRDCSAQVWDQANIETREICLLNHNLQIENNETALLECLLREHECVPTYCRAEHLWSQGFFASRPSLKGAHGASINDGPHIDSLLPMEEIGVRLPQLLAYAAQKGTNSDFHNMDLSNPTARNAATAKPAKVQQMINATNNLLDSGTFMSILCRMYMQDFVCFDNMDTPLVCKAMLDKAFSWDILQRERKARAACTT